VCTSSQEQVLAEISKLTLVLCFLNGEITFIYIRLSISKVVSVIHQFAKAGFPEELPENEQSMMIFADF
jgi:hypothetical protein